VSKVDKIKSLLEACSTEEQFAVLNYLKSRLPGHPLEAEWGVDSDVILSAISRSSDLTKRGMRGIIAEAVFADKILLPLVEAGWKAAEILDDRPYDFLIQNGKTEVRIQVKLQRTEKGIPKIASRRLYTGDEMYIVEVQKTRTGKDATTQEDTRPYRFGEFDILAVSIHPSTKDWTKFLFSVSNWLLPRAENNKLIQIMQPVPKQPNDCWTDNLATCIGWLAKKKKKRIL
jgi:hypothetical protein